MLNLKIIFLSQQYYRQNVKYNVETSYYLKSNLY